MARPCSSAVPSRAGPAARSSPCAVAFAEQQPLVGFVLLPVDVAGVGVGDQRDPLLAGQGVEGLLAVGGEAFAAAAVGERAGVAGVVQGAQHPPVLQRHPRQLALAGAGAHPHREQQPVGVELLHHRAGGTGAGEQGEYVPDGLLHTGIRVEHHVVGGVVDQPDGQAHAQFAAAGLGQLPADEAGADEVQLGLAHGALQAEQQPVVEVGRVIQAVLVADQRARHGADLQQPVPVGVVAGQPGHLQTQHDPGPAHADLGDQALEALPVGGRGAGLALVGIDGDDVLGRPAQRDRFLPQRVLAGGGLGVGQHLPQRGLAHIQVGGAGQVRAGHLRRGLLAHARSPPCRDSQRHRGEQLDQLGVDPAGHGGIARAGADRAGVAAVRRRSHAATPRCCNTPSPSRHPSASPDNARRRNCS